MAIQNKKSEQTSKLFALFHLGPNRTLRLRALLAKLAIELGHTDQELLHRHYRELVKPEQAEKY